MITVYVNLNMAGPYDEDVINWMIGWLYRHKYTFKYSKYDYSGIWKVNIYKRYGVPVTNIFEFILGDIISDLYVLAQGLGIKVAIEAHDKSNCIRLRWSDIKRLKRWEAEWLAEELQEDEELCTDYTA